MVPILLSEPPNLIKASPLTSPSPGPSPRTSKEPQKCTGLNGETCWVLITDHFTNRYHCDTRTSKAAPLEWLKAFLSECSPKCNDKCVHMDQGGELHKNPKVRQLFESYGYTIKPTGADTSRQNAPAERGHLHVANSLRAMLIGAKLDARFWPCAFHHFIRIQNALMTSSKEHSPIKMATGREQTSAPLRVQATIQIPWTLD